MMKTKALFTVALLSVVLIGCSNDSPSYKILGIELGKATGETLISYFDNKKIEYEFESIENPWQSEIGKLKAESRFSTSHKFFDIYGARDEGARIGKLAKNVRFWIEGSDPKSLVTDIEIKLQNNDTVIESYLESLKGQYGWPIETHKFRAPEKEREICDWIWYLDSLKVTLSRPGDAVLKFEYDPKYRKGVRYNEADKIFEN